MLSFEDRVKLLVWRWLDYSNVDGLTRQQQNDLVERIIAEFGPKPEPKQYVGGNVTAW